MSTLARTRRKDRVRVEETATSGAEGICGCLSQYWQLATDDWPLSIHFLVDFPSITVAHSVPSFDISNLNV